MLKELIIETKQREEIIDVTDPVEQLVKEAGIKSGICCLFVSHTSAGLTINENLDDTVSTDILDTFNKIAPVNGNFKHCHDGNGDSHIKAAIIGGSVSIIINNSRLLLGRWQRILFCEFDGPKDRKIFVKLISG